MSIAVECPHCETRFHLQPELAGKMVRCPNLDCRQVFEFAAALPPLPMIPRDETPAPRPEPVPEVVEAELAPAPPPKAKPRPPKPPKPARTEPRPPKVVEAVVVQPTRPKPAADGPKEVVWTPDADLPPAVPAPPPPPRYEEVRDDDGPVRRRRRRTNRGPIILVGLVVLAGLTAGAGGLYYVRYLRLVQERHVVQAEGLYKDGKYPDAKKSFEEIVVKYPDHADVEKYRFFADLSALQTAARTVTNRDNPRPALAALKTFADARKDSPFAKPDQFGNDVFDAGKKVAEDAADYAGDRVKGFTGDRAKLKDLSDAEEMIAAGRAVPTLVEPFQPKEAVGFDAPLAKFTAAEAGIKQARFRISVLDRVTQTLQTPTDQAVVEAKADLAANGLADDPEGRELVSRAEADFLRRVRYDADPAAPAPPAAGGPNALLFVAPVGAGKTVPRGALEDPPTVFLAVARGVLYALDEDTGDLLWAARVGADVFDPPAVTRIDSAEGPTDVAVVLGNVAGVSEATGRVLRSGQERWRQVLPAPAAGPAAVVAGRAFVPLRDPAGTVLVIDLATGARVGRLTLGQAAAQVVARPGTNELFVAADARRVFVFDATPGTNPRCVRVVTTGHPAGSIRTTPVVLGPPGDAPAPRHLLLCQADGPAAMKLRAFPIVNTPALAADAPPVTDPIAPEAELPVPGWVWFPPVSDGERLAAVTDAGQFRLFGVNLPGNRDPALFALPAPPLPTPPDGAPVPGLAVPAEDGAFWVLANGALQKYRLRLHPVRGLELVADGKAEPVGAPTQPVQMNPRRDTACFVVRSGNSSGCRAVAVRLQDGEPRWRRQLGLVPGGPAVRTADGVLLADEDGGAVHVPLAALADAKAADPAWVVASGPGAATGPTAVATGANGLAFTVTPTVGEKGPQWVIRTFTNGALKASGNVPAPGAVAGPPIVLGGVLLIPASDGAVHRFTPGDGKSRTEVLARGPTWLTDRRAPDPVCYLVALDGDRFAGSDGGKALVRWEWPAGAAWKAGDARWELRDRVASPPLYLPAAGGRPARLLAAEATGGVWLFAAERGGDPLRRWLPGRTVSLPGGRVGPFGFAPESGRVCYAVEGKADERAAARWVVGLDPDRDEAAWVSPADEPTVGAPVPLPDGRWLVTDRAGVVTAHAADTGRPTGRESVGLPGAVPAAAGVPTGPAAVLVPLTDGSAALAPVPAAAKA
ncbi:PQQ-binding-like beta-propeller repeat protein [bacterium]|nr:PQQ-binding-like beta-propeller repeat protein [bacterium]